MANIFCTLALGAEHAGYARFLADDLADFKQTLAVVTDQPELFRRCRNVTVTVHRPASFSYHDKRLALQAALKLGDTAVFIDADCALRFGVPRALALSALNHEFQPGLHGWSIAPADIFDYSHIEAMARSWGLKFNRNEIVYWEGLFALRSEGEKDRVFFAIWDHFYEEARSRNFNGAGEGACFGIAAQACGMTCHGTGPMRASRLANILWHTRLNWRLRRLYHLKFKMKSWFNLEPPSDWTQVEICGRDPRFTGELNKTTPA
jgi:hypothetical protein